MAVRSRVVSVETTATALNDSAGRGDPDRWPAVVLYNDGSVTVYLGGEDVTTSGDTKGLPLTAGASMDIDVPDEIVYGIVASGTCDVIVFEVGVAAA